MTDGTVKSLWRWPVAGMGGERLRSTRMDSKGIAGDRQHLIFGPEGRLTPAELPGLARWRAAYPFNPDGAIVTKAPPPYPVLTGPGGARSWRWGDPRLAFALERDLGRPVELIRDPAAQRGVVIAAAAPAAHADVAGVNLLLDLELPPDPGWSGLELTFAGGVRLKLIASRADGPGIEARVVTAGRVVIGEALVLG